MEKNTHQKGLEIGADINWEQVRNHAAIAALQGIMSSCTRWDQQYYIFKGISVKTAAEEAVLYADSLVAELKKKRENKDK